MKDLARRIVNMYVFKALWPEHAVSAEFICMHNQSAGAAGYKNLNAHAKFVHRFHAWSTSHYASCMQDMQCMDDFFEREDYLWEDHILT